MRFQRKNIYVLQGSFNTNLKKIQMTVHYASLAALVCDHWRQNKCGYWYMHGKSAYARAKYKTWFWGISTSADNELKKKEVVSCINLPTYISCAGKKTK